MLHDDALPPPPALLLTGGRVIDPASGTDAALDVALERGRVAAIGRGLSPGGGSSPALVVDVRGRIVAPGLIDPHVHLREPGAEHKETIWSGCCAAAEGGFTTVCCMPNTTPALDTPEMIALVRERARQAAACGLAPRVQGASVGAAPRVFAVGAVSKGRHGETMAEVGLMRREGAVGFSDDGDCVASAGLMARALTAVKATGVALMQHCQEPTLTRGAAMHAGALATRMGLGGWPGSAEEIIIERDVRLNRGVGCAYHVQHISTAGAVEIVRGARREGLPVTAEAAPHHLLLTEDACAGFNTAAKMNPPLRTRADVEAVRAGVADGTITVLATDHAPHTADEKALPFDAAPFGIIGLETALALYVQALAEPGLLGWPGLLERMTINPARLCGLAERGLGALRVGGPADVTVIDPDEAWTIEASALRGKCVNTPFLGRAVRGRATMTIVGGRVAMRRA